MASSYELFPHGADTGVRGVGPSREAAFEQAALALTSIVTEPEDISPNAMIEIECDAPDDALLLSDWLNEIIYQMAVRKMVFGRYVVAIEGRKLTGRAWGEPIDRIRHSPAVEPKGATFTALDVRRMPTGVWIAECVIDV
jgi:tRNA nucleotidyltransferase (CCA-adding enzyme)